MHVAMIIDEERLTHEQNMLNRLGVGLMAEGVQLTRIVPDGQAAEVTGQGEQRVALAPRLEAPMRVLPWMRRARVSRLLEALGDPAPDVILAVGEQAWPLGSDLAKEAERPVVLDVWSAGLARTALRSSLSQIGGYVAPCAAIATELRARVDEELVSIVPIGVSVPAEPAAILAGVDGGRPGALAILGGSRDVAAYQSLFGGLSRVLRAGPPVQIFLELRGPHEHEIWRHAQRLDLLGAVSAIGEAAHYRSLVTHCDLLIMPEALGELRSLMFEAMALGMPVIAADDPALDMLEDGRSAILVRTGDADEWAQQVLRALSDPGSAREIGLAGREVVSRSHRSSEQLGKLLETLEGAVRGAAMPFPTLKSPPDA